QAVRVKADAVQIQVLTVQEEAVGRIDAEVTQSQRLLDLIHHGVVRQVQHQDVHLVKVRIAAAVPQMGADHFRGLYDIRAAPRVQRYAAGHHSCDTSRGIEDERDDRRLAGNTAIILQLDRYLQIGRSGADVSLLEIDPRRGVIRQTDV